MSGELQKSGKCAPEVIVKALYRLANVVSCAPTENDLYPYIQEAISPVIDTTNFFIGLYDETADRLTFPYVVDVKDRVYSAVEQVSTTDTNSAEVIRTGQAVLMSRQQTESLRATSVRGHHRSSIAEIWLGAPLKARGRVVGVVVVQSYTDPYLYDHTDLKFLVSVAGIVGPALDFQRTDRLRQENELRYHRISENTTDAIFVTDMAGQIMDVNRAACDTLGYSREEILKMTVADIDCEISNEEYKGYYQNSPEGMSRNFEAVHQRRDGSTFPVEISSLKYRENNRDYIIGIARDITERKKSEEELRIFAERMQAYFSSANDAILVHPLQEGGFSSFVEVNDIACTRYGYTHDEFLQLTADDITKVKDTDLHTLAHYRKELFEHGSLVFETTHVKKSGEEFPVEISSNIIRQFDKPFILSFVRDVSERKKAEAEREKLEQQLHQAQRMDSIGRLAGGIAHDFNNLLMGIQGRVSLLQILPDLSYKVHEHLDAMDDYIKSATSLTAQLLGFARGGKYNTEVIDVGELVRKSSAMFGRTRKEIRLRVAETHEVVLVEADRQQLEQVLLNMYINAWQAMPGGGSLTITVSEGRVDERMASRFQVKPGRFARISVEDTGVGMDEEIRDHIFDPFFTTKEKGRGTGLGLASAYGIIKNHNGFITVTSELNRGTQFTVYLPASNKELSPVAELSGVELKDGTGTVLLIDDEDMVLQVGSAMLNQLGYSVVTVDSGERGLEILEKGEVDIDLVILDMIMPGMDGGQVYDELRNKNRQLPVILSSGYSLDGQAGEIMEKGARGFLQKPFTLSALSEKIQEVLQVD